MMRAWYRFIWLKILTSGEHGNEPLGSIKDGELLDQLGNYWLVKTNSASWS
jgi:hypothetical protein